MAALPVHNVQVVMNNQVLGAGHAANGGRPNQVFSVDKALQFTPLTTSVLSACDRIPIPQIGRARQNSHISTPTERKAIQKTVGSRPPLEVKDRLNTLLTPESLAEIKFKRPANSTNELSCSVPEHGQIASTRHLTPTARMVLDMAEIEYRYPTPTSPSSRGTTSPKRLSQARSLPTPAVSRSPESRAYNEMAVGYDPARLLSTHSALSRPDFTIELPQLPSAYLKQYASAPGSPKRQKLDEADQNSTFLHVKAQKEVADATLQHFQNLLIGLFEAHDQIEPDSLSYGPQGGEYFDLPEDDDHDSGLRISTQFLGQLQMSLKKLVKLKRVNDISSDHLQRLQRLCEHSIEAAQTVNLKVEIEAGEDELKQWRTRLLKAENGAMSACTILWTILGNLKHDDLVPEDIFKWLPNVLLNIFENCIIPVVESRPESKPGEGRDTELFKIAGGSQDVLKRVLDSGKKLLDLVATTCVQLRDTDGMTNAVEFLAAKLIFVQNGPTDKLSVLGNQIFEKVRKVAMTVLAKIYARFPKERPTIMHEILTSLDKLPSTSRSARQYKLVDGKSIQLMTALVMLLVQTTTLKPSNRSDSSRPRILDTAGEISSENEEDDAQQYDTNDRAYGSPLEQLRELVDHPYDDGAKSAQDIIYFIVQRASTKGKPGKSGEDNSREIAADYRNFLDFFVEDLLVVLPSPDWPAAELLLRMLAKRMLHIAQFEKAASTKNMALEILGGMGSTISSLRASVNNFASSQSRDVESSTDNALQKLAQEQSLGSLRTDDLLRTSGPFEMVYQSLLDSDDNSLRADSARGFFLAQWSKLLCHTLKDAEAKTDIKLGRLVKSLLHQILGTSTAQPLQQSEYRVSATEGRLAYTLTILNLSFCRSFGEIIKRLVASFSSDQAQVRSRSLKSVVTILEIDSSLLDRDASITDDIFSCASDDSAMVRDSALSLIAKFVVTRPALEEKAIRRLLECAADSKVGVQKRAIGHLKDIYLRDSRPALQAAIAETLLRSLQDPEETVAELALRTLAEVWITPYLAKSSANDSAISKVNVQNLALTIVRTVSQKSDELPPALAGFLASTVKQDFRSSTEVTTLCTQIASELFDRIISDQDLSSGIDKQAFLLTLKIFAESNPRAIGPDQLQALRPYLGNLVKADDLNFFRPVVAVFRCVLPNLSGTQKPLLQEIQGDLMKTIAKLMRRAELDEVMACLWTIDGVLQNTEKLAALTISVLNNLAARKFSTEAETQYIRILGAIGKQWDLEKHLSLFRQRIDKWTGSSVATFMADLICSFTGPSFPASRRAVALESLGSIFQAWPMECNKREIWASLLNVFHEPINDHVQQASLQTVVLAAFAELLGSAGAEKTPGKGEEVGVEQAIGDMGGDKNSRQLAIVMGQVAQRFLPHILGAALAEPDRKAMIATKVITGINKQGLGHPKDCLGAMVALGSGQNQSIADAAFSSHQMMHLQHASTYQRGYLDAVETAFRYHRDIYKDSMGCFRPGYQAKLSRCFEIINTSNVKYVKSFLAKLVDGATRDLFKSEIGDGCPDNLLLARFIFQNLAFLPYNKLDELLHLLLYIETELSQRGPEIIQAIEPVLHMIADVHIPSDSVEGINTVLQTGVIDLAEPNTIEPAQLKKLATAATILTMMWETRSFLKRQYGITSDVGNALSKIKKDRDAAKPALKVHGITGDKYWDKCSVLVLALEDGKKWIGVCKEFAELMTVNDEIKVVGDDDGTRELYSASVELEENVLKPPGSGRGRKRKSSLSAAGTPSKKRGRLPLKRARMSSTSSREDPEADFEM